MYRADIELLNHSIDELGDTFLKKRQLKEQERKNLQDEILRREANANAEKHYGAEEKFREAQGKHYEAMESKADSANALAEQRAQLQDKQQLIQNIIHMNTAGMLKGKSLDDVNSWLKNDPHFGPTGIQLNESEKPMPQAGQNALAQAFQQADQWEAKANDAEQEDPNDSRIEQWRGYAQMLRDWGKTSSQPKPEKPMKTGETVDPATGSKTFQFSTPSSIARPTPIPGTTDTAADFVLDPKTFKIVPNPNKQKPGTIPGLAPQ